MGQYLECGNTVFSDLYVDLTFCSIRVFYYLYLFVGHILTPYLTNFIRSSANTFPNGESFHGQIKFQTLTYTNYHSDEFTILDIKRKWRQDSNLFLPSPLPLPLPLCSCYSTYFLLFFLSFLSVNGCGLECKISPHFVTTQNTAKKEEPCAS